MKNHYFLYTFFALLLVAFLSFIGHNWAYSLWGEYSWPSATFFYLVFIAFPLAIVALVVYLFQLLAYALRKK